MCAVGWWASLRPVSTTWGSVAEWVAGIGTVLTLGAAVFAIRQEFGSIQEDRARLRRFQGSHVSAGIASYRRDRKLGMVYDLVIVNASDLPIYNVTAVVGPPAGHGDAPLEVNLLHLAARSEERSPIPASSSPTGAIVFYDLRFKDAAGLGWLRGSDGDLVEIEPPTYLGCS